MDRWSIVTTLNYLPHEQRSRTSCSPRPKHYRTDQGPRHRKQDGGGSPTSRANAFMNGDISTVMRPRRTVITWAENADIFKDHRLRLQA